MKLNQIARTAWLWLAIAAAPAFAVPLMDMKAEDLVPMATEFRKSLNLNANQQTLWAQVESRSKNLLRERKARRDKLQAATRAGLEAQNVELRDLQAALDAELATSAAEDRQLREWWLGVNDALDDSQRQSVAKFLAEQLIRMEDGPGRAGGERPAGGESGHRRGGHGGGMGMPGGAGPGH